MLDAFNISYDLANNGQQAIDKIKIRKVNNKCCDSFQAIFMDIDMPVKNGYQAAKEIEQFYT